MQSKYLTILWLIHITKCIENRYIEWIRYVLMRDDV